MWHKPKHILNTITHDSNRYTHIYVSSY